MTPGMLAAVVASLALDDLETFVKALPRPTFAVLREVADDRVWAERWRHLPAPAPVVVAAPAVDRDALLTAEEAAHVLRISVDTLYARVQRGEVVAEPRPPGGRLKFRRANVCRTPVASGIAPRYSGTHDPRPRQGIAAPARLDTTRARRRVAGDDDDRRALGARGAGRDPHGRGVPYAPGKAAWSGPRDPDPKDGGA
jgi:excisionase family DNA binding protein